MSEIGPCRSAQGIEYSHIDRPAQSSPSVESNLVLGCSVILAAFLVVTLHADTTNWCERSHTLGTFHRFQYGSLEFTDLTGVTCSSDPQDNELVNGQWRARVTLRITQSHLRLLPPTGNRAVLEGDASNVNLTARIALVQGLTNSYFHVAPSDLHLTLATTVRKAYPAGGGTIDLPAPTQIDVANETDLTLDRPTMQSGLTGTLALRVRSSVRWPNLHIAVTGVPADLRFALETGPAAPSEWTFSLSDGRFRLRHATFHLIAPTRLVTHGPYPIVAPNYRARVTAVAVDRLDAVVDRTRIALTARALRVEGELVGRDGDAPVGLTGKAIAKSLATESALDASPVAVEDPFVSGLVIQPTLRSPPIMTSRRGPMPKAPPAPPSPVVSPLQPWEVGSWADSALVELGLTSLSAQRDSALREASRVLDTLQSPNALLHAPVWLLMSAGRSQLPAANVRLDTLEAGEQVLTGVMQSAQSLGTDSGGVTVIIRAIPAPMPNASGFVIRYAVVLPAVSASRFGDSLRLSEITDAVVGADHAASHGIENASVPVALDPFTLAIPPLSHQIGPVNGVAGTFQIAGASASMAVHGSVPLVDSQGVHLLLHVVTQWGAGQ